MSYFGNQRPRIHTGPSYDSSPGKVAIELAALGGLKLDPWQEHVLTESLGEKNTPEGRKWAAFQVGLVVPRQNGKGSILEARELFGLFMEPRERLILHSAHEFKTSSEAFTRIKACIDHSDYLTKKVKKFSTSHGEEGIELVNGSRLRFVARSTGSGRGFTCDCLILDEAYNLSASAVAALLPTMSARPNGQVWYTSSAGMITSEELRRIRILGRRGVSQQLLYMEWSMDENGDIDDKENWKLANPATGYRLTMDAMQAEREAMSDDTFARERLGVWDENVVQAVIDVRTWQTVKDEQSRPGSELVFAIDCTPERSAAAISSAGRRSDGRLHVKIVDHRPGTDWVIDRIGQLVETYKPSAVVLDPSGPASSFLSDLQDIAIEPVCVSGREMAQACGAFHNDVINDRLRHCNQENLNSALRSARTRSLGEAWAWSRRDSSADICPLVAATLALHGFREHGGRKGDGPWVMFD